MDVPMPAAHGTEVRILPFKGIAKRLSGLSKTSGSSPIPRSVFR